MAKLFSDLKFGDVIWAKRPDLEDISKMRDGHDEGPFIFYGYNENNEAICFMGTSSIDEAKDTRSGYLNIPNTRYNKSNEAKDSYFYITDYKLLPQKDYMYFCETLPEGLKDRLASQIIVISSINKKSNLRNLYFTGKKKHIAGDIFYYYPHQQNYLVIGYDREKENIIAVSRNYDENTKQYITDYKTRLTLPIDAIFPVYDLLSPGETLKAQREYKELIENEKYVNENISTIQKGSLIEYKGSIYYVHDIKDNKYITYRSTKHKEDDNYPLHNCNSIGDQLYFINFATEYDFDIENDLYIPRRIAYPNEIEAINKYKNCFDNTQIKRAKENEYFSRRLNIGDIVKINGDDNKYIIAENNIPGKFVLYSLNELNDLLPQPHQIPKEYVSLLKDQSYKEFFDAIDNLNFNDIKNDLISNELRNLKIIINQKSEIFSNGDIIEYNNGKYSKNAIFLKYNNDKMVVFEPGGYITNKKHLFLHNYEGYDLSIPFEIKRNIEVSYKDKLDDVHHALLNKRIKYIVNTEECDKLLSYEVTPVEAGELYKIGDIFYLATVYDEKENGVIAYEFTNKVLNYKNKIVLDKYYDGKIIAKVISSEMKKILDDINYNSRINSDSFIGTIIHHYHPYYIINENNNLLYGIKVEESFYDDANVFDVNDKYYVFDDKIIELEKKDTYKKLNVANEEQINTIYEAFKEKIRTKI